MKCNRCNKEGAFSGHNKICNSCRSPGTWGTPEQRREYQLKAKYGITLEDYDAILEEQAGLCAICFTPAEDERFGVLCVDHCHDTGRVRGLLCRCCNSGLGKLRDDPELCLQAYKYLKDD